MPKSASKQTLTSVSSSVTAENTFTSSLELDYNDRSSISVSGTWSGTVTLQRKIDGTNWRDVASWTSNIEASYCADEFGDIRIGIKTGDFSSGTAVVRLGTQ